MRDGQYAFEKSKIIQGDCLEKMKLIPDGGVDMILADLPYGTTVCKWDSIIPFEPLWRQYERIIKANGAIVLTASQPFTSALVMSNPKMFKYELIWHKDKPTDPLNAKKRVMKYHEGILIFYRKPPTYNPQKVLRDETNKRNNKPRKFNSAVNNSWDNNTDEVLKMNQGTSDYIYPNSVNKWNMQRGLHPTQKPVKMFEWLIKTYTNEGDTVLDNVAGSGTTGEACINLNRDFILIEKEPNYYEVIKERVGKIFKNYGLDLQPLLDERM